MQNHISEVAVDTLCAVCASQKWCNLTCSRAQRALLPGENCPQLVEQRTGNAEVTGSNRVEALIFFLQASSFQLLKLENLLQ